LADPYSTMLQWMALLLLRMTTVVVPFGRVSVAVVVPLLTMACPLGNTMTLVPKA